MNRQPYWRCYTDDLIAGTYMMNDRVFGQYIRLLLHQHQHDPIPENVFLTITHSRNIENVSPDLMSKFLRDENGSFYNARMRSEIFAGKMFRERQSNASQKRWEKSKPNPSILCNKITGDGDGDGDDSPRIGNPAGMPRDKEKKVNTMKPNELKYPFDSIDFKNIWSTWIEYKREQFKFKYKSPVSENMALKQLAKDSGNDEKRAIELIEYAIAHGWKGIYNIDTNISNGKTNQSNHSGRGRDGEPSGDYSADKMRL